MSLTYLNIEFAHEFLLKFRLLKSPLTDLWVERMQNRKDYPLDHPDRFYNFNTAEVEITKAESMITACINIINAHSPIIEKKFVSANDQDTLNYLHNIFERFHGMLDQQDREFWNTAPDTVRHALADLNLCVHRCETAVRSRRPRLVCTWFGMPKIKKLPYEQIADYLTLHYRFGTVYLNYTEIGKTLLDFATDDDHYAADEMFQPFEHYSADFNVRFYDTSDQDVEQNLNKVKKYFNQNLEFFSKYGYKSFDNLKILPYNFPVAELETELTRESVLKEIAARQFITNVYLT